MGFSATFIGCSTHFSAPRFLNIRPVTCHYSRKANRRSIIFTRIITIMNGMIVGRHFSLTQTMCRFATYRAARISITRSQKEHVFDLLPCSEPEQRTWVRGRCRHIDSADRVNIFKRYSTAQAAAPPCCLNSLKRLQYPFQGQQKQCRFVHGLSFL